MTRALALAVALAIPLGARGAGGRFAVVAGNNQGLPERRPLLFAERDADRIRRALVELGGFAEDGIRILRGSGAAELRAAMADLEGPIAAARARGERALLLVYYSGHASGSGLELGRDLVAFEELKALVRRSAADAKVVIVDACEAGALTQVKGATPSSAVAFPLPADDVQGTAYIASTALGQPAQESVELGGSFFTHHLEVGMRGAADGDGDGLVTLAEAFRYTSAMTRAGTAATAEGVQNATYDFRMSGRGDVVLADLRRAEARLLVPADPGAVFVLRGPRRFLAEVPAGPAELALALPAGSYALERRAPEGRARGSIELSRGETRAMPRLVPTAYELARAKGGPRPTEWFAGAGAALVGLPGGGLAPSFAFGLRQEVGPLGLVGRLEYTAGDVADTSAPQTLRYGYSRIGLALAALAPLLGSRVLAEGGIEVSAGYDFQSMSDGRHFQTPDVGAAALLRLSLPAFWGLRAAIDLTAGGRVLRLDGQASLRPTAGLTAVLLYGT